MRLILAAAVAVTACSGADDCEKLAERYAQAFANAQRCVPGVDTCSYKAATPYRLADGGLAVADCENCGPGNTNPNRARELEDAIAAYHAGCHFGVACLCAIPDGGFRDYTCRPSGDGGVCAP